jgi:hypothetical protein
MTQIMSVLSLFPYSIVIWWKRTKSGAEFRLTTPPSVLQRVSAGRPALLQCDFSQKTKCVVTTVQRTRDSYSYRSALLFTSSPWIVLTLSPTNREFAVLSFWNKQECSFVISGIRLCSMLLCSHCIFRWLLPEGFPAQVCKNTESSFYPTRCLLLHILYLQ